MDREKETVLPDKAFDGLLDDLKRPAEVIPPLREFLKAWARQARKDEESGLTTPWPLQSEAVCDHDWVWQEYDCDCSADTSYAECSKCGAVSHDPAVIEPALKRASALGLLRDRVE